MEREIPLPGRANEAARGRNTSQYWSLSKLKGELDARPQYRCFAAGLAVDEVPCAFGKDWLAFAGATLVTVEIRFRDV
jgi:hypothetical protein